MSDCKINQFMEFGDIIYLLLMLAFFVFGIFNDSKKKKKKVDTSTPPINPEYDRKIRDVFREVFQHPEKQSAPPPVPKTAKIKSQAATPSLASVHSATHREFQSSLDLVTNFEGESSLKGSLFTSELFDKQKEMKVTETFHPILEQLRSKEGQSEIRKAVIYSEILNRKY